MADGDRAPYTRFRGFGLLPIESDKPVSSAAMAAIFTEHPSSTEVATDQTG